MDYAEQCEKVVETLKKKAKTKSKFYFNDLSKILELGYNDPAVSVLVVDRLIPRIAYHIPDLPDPTPEVIKFIKNRQPPKPTIFTVDSEGGDEDLALTGTRLRAQFCKTGIPAYPSARRAARALTHLRQYHGRKRC